MQDTNITFEIMKILISLVSLIITYYAIPYLKSKANNEKFKQVQDWANIIVYALQQKNETVIENNPDNKPNINQEKFTEALGLVEKMCNENGINLSKYEISMLIESAVKNMKIAESLQNTTENSEQ